MELVKRVAQGAEPRIWTLTAAACGLGALAALAAMVQRIRCHRKAKSKIARARERRAESLQRAEQAVRRYKDSVRRWSFADSMFAEVAGTQFNVTDLCSPVTIAFSKSPFKWF